MVIGEEAKKILENSVGLPLNQVSDLGIHGEVGLVKTKTGKAPQFSKARDSRKIGRGNPLLARNRIITMEEINTKIDAL
jgi:hypothetical protein